MSNNNATTTTVSKSGFEIDNGNKKYRNTKPEKLILGFKSPSEFKIVVKIYEVYSREFIVRVKNKITPGLLAKQIILGTISDKTIEDYVKMFEDKFTDFKKPVDVSSKMFLLDELSTHFYRFYADPSIWMYKPTDFIDVDELSYTSQKTEINSNCDVIITRLDNNTTKYEILLKVNFNNLHLKYPNDKIRDEETIIRKYQEFKYRICYNDDLYPLEILTSGLFKIKKHNFYRVQTCCIYVTGPEDLTEVISDLSVIERSLNLKHKLIEI